MHLAPSTNLSPTNTDQIDPIPLPLSPTQNPSQPPSPIHMDQSSLNTSFIPLPIVSSFVADSSPPPAFTRMVTRSQTGHLKPKQFPRFKMFHSTRHPLLCLHTIHLLPTPSTYTQAADHPEWIAAMTSEYQALISNHTWTLCPRPLHHNVVKNKWVFKIKQKLDGSVDRFKARLVANRFNKKCGIDYHETFSLVIKLATIQLLLILVVQFNWELRQLDVSNAFFYAVLEEVYMEQPPWVY
jgi:hypothetical protein